MMKLMAKLKPYWKLVALSILMLSVQSICNLMLPNLMSSIVNDGVETGRDDAGGGAALGRGRRLRQLLLL